MDQWLQDLGAHRLLPLALGDEDTLEDDFQAWAESLSEIMASNNLVSN